MKYDEIIPLGYDCTIARQLDNLKFRTKAYPFDWLVTKKTKGVVESILEDFKLFFNLEKNEKGIYYNDYGMIFLHHSHFTRDKFNFEFNKKISRFKENLKSDKKILLIRKLHGTHAEDYCKSNDNNNSDITEMSKLREYIDTINPNNNIDITTLISCETCYNNYKHLLSDDNRLKVDILFEPNGDDNEIYKKYLDGINKL